LIEGFHEGSIENEEEPKEKATEKEEPKAEAKKEEPKEVKLDKGKYGEGFKATYWFFNGGTNQKGYKTEGKRPDLVKSTKVINFKNDGEFKKQSKDFPNDHFACEWEGKFWIEKEGKYNFFTRSDDGSRLWINEKQVVDNWGLHGAREKKGTVELKAGWH